MTDKHSLVLEIQSKNKQLLEKLYHEFHKESEQAARYGESVSVRRVNIEDKEVVGFDES